MQKGPIAWFGIRGMDSIYYLAYVFSQENFPRDLGGKINQYNSECCGGVNHISWNYCDSSHDYGAICGEKNALQNLSLTQKERGFLRPNPKWSRRVFWFCLLPLFFFNDIKSQNLLKKFPYWPIIKNYETVCNRK